MATMTKAKQIALAAISGLTNTGGSVQSGIEAVVASSVRAIAADSQNYLSIVNGNELHVKELLIISVTTDSTYASLAAWITGTGYNGTQMQMGDTLILSAATGGTQIYINNGTAGGTSADFTLIRNPDVTSAFIRSQLSGGNGITYNSSTGAISVNLDTLSGLAFNTGAMYVATDNATIEKNSSTGVLQVKAAGIGRTQIDNTVGAVDASFIKITAATAGQAIGNTVQQALTAIDAKTLGTVARGTVACPVSVASTNFTVTLPGSPVAGQPQTYSINGIRTLAVSVAGAVATFNVPYAVDATDAVEYEYFA